MRFVIDERWIVYAENRLRAIQLLRESGRAKSWASIQPERLEDAVTKLVENKR